MMVAGSVDAPLLPVSAASSDGVEQMVAEEAAVKIPSKLLEIEGEENEYVDEEEEEEYYDEEEESQDEDMDAELIQQQQQHQFYSPPAKKQKVT